MLPDADGADVCKQLRDWLRAPILLISAVGEEGDKIRALDAGADDYLTKPFGIGELLARVRALLRRSEGAVSGEQVIEVGAVAIDLPHRIVTASGNEMHLTPTEFDLLKELALAEGRPLTHRMLLRKVWGPGYQQECSCCARTWAACATSWRRCAILSVGSTGVQACLEMMPTRWSNEASRVRHFDWCCGGLANSRACAAIPREAAHRRDRRACPG